MVGCIEAVSMALKEVAPRHDPDECLAIHDGKPTDPFVQHCVGGISKGSSRGNRDEWSFDQGGKVVRKACRGEDVALRENAQHPAVVIHHWESVMRRLRRA